MKELDFSLIGQRIREVRCEKHLTQEYLANATGVNVSHISNIETNKVKVSLTLLVQILFIVKYKCRKLQTKNVGRCNYIL